MMVRVVEVEPKPCVGCAELAKRVEELERIVLRRLPDRVERAAERQRRADGL